MIRRVVKLVVAVPLAVSLLSSCIVVGRPAAPCPGARWVEGHYDRRGVWHAAHWWCPGMVEEEVIIRR